LVRQWLSRAGVSLHVGDLLSGNVVLDIVRIEDSVAALSSPWELRCDPSLSVLLFAARTRRVRVGLGTFEGWAAEAGVPHVWRSPGADVGYDRAFRDDVALREALGEVLGERLLRRIEDCSQAPLATESFRPAA
jgi:hypothetical protein